MPAADPKIAIPEELKNLIQAARLADERSQIGVTQALNDAVQTWEKVVEHPLLLADNLPQYLEQLGDSLVRRYKYNTEIPDLEQAILYFQQAVRLTLENHHDLPAYLNNLGRALLDRFNHLGELPDLEQAILHWQQTVKLTTESHPNLPDRPALAFTQRGPGAVVRR